MREFDPGAYGDSVGPLLAGDRLCELGPGTPRGETRVQLQALTPTTLFGAQAVTDNSMAAACISGLWLLHDFLDESHTISQSISTTTGSYWHGIMHRREPDYSNAKYWFRRVGQHPIFDALNRQAGELIADQTADTPLSFLPQQAAWDSIAFVDLCQSASSPQETTADCVRKIARVEWQLLFDYCYREATR